MVLPSATADRIFVEHAQSRSGFARVENSSFGAMDCVNILARSGGNAAQPLKDVQNDALAGKQRPRVVPHHGNGLPFTQPDAIKDLAMADDFRVTDHIAVQMLI